MKRKIIAHWRITLLHVLFQQQNACVQPPSLSAFSAHSARFSLFGLPNLCWLAAQFCACSPFSLTVCFRAFVSPPACYNARALANGSKRTWSSLVIWTGHRRLFFLPNLNTQVSGTGVVPSTSSISQVSTYVELVCSTYESALQEGVQGELWGYVEAVASEEGTQDVEGAIAQRTEGLRGVKPPQWTDLVLLLEVLRRELRLPAMPSFEVYSPSYLNTVFRAQAAPGDIKIANVPAGASPVLNHFMIVRH